jgi:hypothetical protein
LNGRRKAGWLRASLPLLLNRWLMSFMRRPQRNADSSGSPKYRPFGDSYKFDYSAEAGKKQRRGWNQ